MRPVFIFAFICLAIALLLGCALPLGSQTQTPDHILAEDMAGKTVFVRKGDLIELRLAENPTTGYVWEWIDSDDPSLFMRDSSFQPGDDKRLGSGGLRSFRFKAESAGTTTIRLELKRPWEKNTDPEERFWITIVVQNR